MEVSTSTGDSCSRLGCLPCPSVALVFAVTEHVTEAVPRDSAGHGSSRSFSHEHIRSFFRLHAAPSAGACAVRPYSLTLFARGAHRYEPPPRRDATFPAPLGKRERYRSGRKTETKKGSMGTHVTRHPGRPQPARGARRLARAAPAGSPARAAAPHDAHELQFASHVSRRNRKK